MTNTETRVGYGVISLLADITEDAIRKSVDERGRFTGDPDLIRKYIELKKYLAK